MTGWREVNNSETLMAQRYSGVCIAPATTIVWPSMPKRRSHSSDNLISAEGVVASGRKYS
jgi:hypothetical protein